MVYPLAKSLDPGNSWCRVSRMLKRLRAIRDAAGLSREKLAFRAGLSAQTVENLENGAGCTMATAQKLASALDVTVGELLGEDRASA